MKMLMIVICLSFCATGAEAGSCPFYDPLCDFECKVNPFCKSE